MKCRRHRNTSGRSALGRKRPKAFCADPVKQAAMRRRWRKRLPALTEELTRLLRSKEIFWELQEVAQGNPAIQNPAAFFDWMRINYVIALSIGVRRLADPSEDSLSLWRLLYEVLEHPGVINRRAHRALYRGVPFVHADRTFDNLVGRGRGTLSQRTVRADLRAIEDAHRRIRRFVNKRIAHRTRPGAILHLPTYGDLNSALETFDRVLCKYYTLLTASGMTTAYATPQYDWRDVLHEAWIPADEDKT